jgi:hypothetical protein
MKGRQPVGQGPTGRKEKSTTTRKAGGLDFRYCAEKTIARQCINRYGCKRVQSTRFENN